jgi:hypothetical protein
MHCTLYTRGLRVGENPRYSRYSTCVGSLRLFVEVLEAVGERRSVVALICELRDEQREGLSVACHLERSSVHGIEAHVADQLRGHCFGVLVSRDILVTYRTSDGPTSLLASRNVITARVNTSGFSRYMRWPVPAMTMRRAHGLWPRTHPPCSMR